MLSPIVAGTLFGTRTLAGMLAGSLVSGVQVRAFHARVCLSVRLSVCLSVCACCGRHSLGPALRTSACCKLSPGRASAVF
jgi:hypothetical protein